MKLIIEVEDDDDFLKVQKLFKLFKLSSVETKKVSRKEKIKSLLKFADENAFHVKQVEILPREERNAR